MNNKSVKPLMVPKANSRSKFAAEQEIDKQNYLNDIIINRIHKQQQSKKIENLIFNMLEKNHEAPRFSKSQCKTNNIFEPNFQTDELRPFQFNDYKKSKDKLKLQLPIISIKKMKGSNEQLGLQWNRKEMVMNENELDLFKQRIYKQYKKQTDYMKRMDHNQVELHQSQKASNLMPHKTPYQIQMESKKKMLQKNKNKANNYNEMNDTLPKFLYLRNILKKNNRDTPQAQGIENEQLINIVSSPQIQKQVDEEDRLNIGGKGNAQENHHLQNYQKKVIKKNMTELKYNGDLSIYEIKIRSYRQFLFMMNLSHRVFDPLSLKEAGTIKPEQKYKFHLGKGNNFMLIKSLLKRRFWWTIEQNTSQSNFVWTQLKVNQFYSIQRPATINNDHHKQHFIEKQEAKSTKLHQAKPLLKAGTFKAPLPSGDMKIFTKYDKNYYNNFLQNINNPEKLLKFENRLKYFEEMHLVPTSEQKVDYKMHNHFENNYFLGNKKALFYNLKQYYDLKKQDVFSIIPTTYHIKHGVNDPNYILLSKLFKKVEKEKKKNSTIKNVWIVKPGQLSNRGQGITVIDQIYELDRILKKKEKHFNGTKKTYIVQKYIEKPLLYKNRKFDIRHYMMMSRLHGVMRAYWFGQGYIRTSSYQYNINDVCDQAIHLTNDAIQKFCDSYGKYEEGNKISYNEFQKYLDNIYGQNKYNFSELIYPKMKNIALDAVKATFLKLDPHKYEHNFQIFGLDFMIDQEFNVWLIEVNTNPCLQFSSKLLERLIPSMVEQSLRLTLDVIFPPPAHYPNSQKHLVPDNPLQRLQFQLIFDQTRDGGQLQDLYKDVKQVQMGQVNEDDDTYENDGKELQQELDIE